MIPDGFVDVQLDLSSSFHLPWVFAISYGGNGVFSFLPLPDPWCSWFVTHGEPSDHFMFAWATPSCSSIPSCIFFPLKLKCFYHLLCMQLLFRAFLLYSVFHSSDTIIGKLIIFLFNNNRQCYCLFFLISYWWLLIVALLSLVWWPIISLIHWQARFMSIPVDRVTLVLPQILVDAGTGYTTEIWENLMNALSMQFLKQPLLCGYAAKMLIQVDLVMLPCLLSLYMINVSIHDKYSWTLLIFT